MALTLTVALAACGSSPEDRRPGARRGSGSAAGGLVGVAMPTKSSERWIPDGDNVKAALEKLGYKVDLQYAEDDIPTQVNQIENHDHQGRQAADHRRDRRHRAHHAAAGGRGHATSRSSPTTG